MLSFAIWRKIRTMIQSTRKAQNLCVFTMLIFTISCSKSDSHHMNHLQNSTSPYLLQHAHQPVDWYSWSEEALQKAKNENKLIIISVGYSTCHWCHVMAHETFDNDSVAAFMNENFVSIKVDREERPDIDQVYMNAVQLMTGQGGWPLNCVALPDGRPIWGGTYFPKDNWVASLKKILEVYEQNPESVLEYASKLGEGMQIQSTLVPTDTLPSIDQELFHVMRHNWSRRWDTVEGGPNKAPKFPLPTNYSFLLRYAVMFEDEGALRQTKLTLDAMYRGGLYDHAGGGFTRYSTDAYWKVPHFEKMLYDNGQLLELYADGYRYFQEPSYKRVLVQTIEFMNRELLSPEGLFYSALDADSEGEEGKFYVWTDEEMKEIIGDEFDEFAEASDWNGRAHWEKGQHILLLKPGASIPEKWDSWMRKILEARSTRIRPGTDTKLLSAWNALAISGLAEAAGALNDSELVKSTIAHGEAFHQNFVHDGLLWHATGKDGTYILGFLDDYATTIRAYIKLNALSADPIWLSRAEELTQTVLEQFGAEENPLFWYTSSNHETLVTRQMETTDNVIPSSNALMARNLIHLGLLLGNTEWEERGLKMTQWVMSEAESYPEGYTEWGQCALDLHGPTRELAIVGENAKMRTRQFMQRYTPNVIIVSSSVPSDLPPFNSRFIEHSTRYYVCEERRCQLPTESESEALQLIPNTVEP